MLIRQRIKSWFDGTKYWREELNTNSCYPLDYQSKSVLEQVAILTKHFPNLLSASYAEEISTHPLPFGAEAWFAIPRRECLWKDLEYSGKAERLMYRLAKTRRAFKSNFGWQDYFGPIEPSPDRETEDALRKLGEQQRGYDILIIPAQFGFRHRGRSVRRAREKYSENEFGLGMFEVAIMLLTHPLRLQKGSLYVSCPGDRHFNFYNINDRPVIMPHTHEFLSEREAWVDAGVASSFFLK